MKTVLINSSTINEEVLRNIASPDSYVRTDYENLISTIKELDVCL